MNVLIIDEEVPWPLDTGKRLRSYNLLQRLQKENQVTYLCYGEPGAELPDCPNVKIVSLSSPITEQRGLGFYWSLFLNIFSVNPYIVNRHYSSLFAAKAQRLIELGVFDLLHCEWTPYAENILHLFGSIPVVLSAHNVEAQIWKRYYDTETNMLKKVYIYIQWRKLEQYESKVAKMFSGVSVVSEPDKEIFVKEYDTQNVVVVPNGVDEKFFSPGDCNVKPNSMVFTGSMDWRPNQDGVKFFIEEVFPLIRSRLADASFVVVGRRPPQWLVDLAARTDGVTVTGTVKDVRPYISQSALYVVPLRVGGGSRLKILEALAMSKVVLSTTIGAEGLEVEENKHIFLEDTARELAEKACRILNNLEQFSHCGEMGRELILERYTWDAIALYMANLWRDACVQDD